MKHTTMSKLSAICAIKHSNRIFLIAGLLMLASELFKQLLLTFSIAHGNYIWWYFPFQLCSIPMYLMPLLPLVKNDTLHAVILCFLSTYNLLGGACAFFDTSRMHYPLSILTVHSYLWHLLLLAIGIYAGLCHIFQMLALNHRKCQTAHSGIVSGRQHKQNARLPRRTFCFTTLLFFVFCLIATGINLSFSRYGEINMFYINPLLPMSQRVFCNVALRFGNLSAIFAYTASIFLASGLLFEFWAHLYTRIDGYTHNPRQTTGNKPD